MIDLITTVLYFVIVICHACIPWIPIFTPPPPQLGQNITAHNNQLGCVGGIRSYPFYWPNAHYYKRYCRTGRGLAVVTGNLASDAALHQTAFIMDNMMATMADYIPDKMRKLGFRQAVMGAWPGETVTDLPEYSHLDSQFWRERRGCGATVLSRVGCNAEEDVLCYADDLYPHMDITVHEFAHSLHKLGFNKLWPQFQQELDASYLNAFTNNLWGSGYVGSYAMENSGNTKFYVNISALK